MAERDRHSAGPSKRRGSKPVAKSPWSFSVAVADVPETGRRVEFSADEPTRDAIARLAGLLKLPRLEASFDLTRQGRDGLRATGKVAACVVQECVVTLEPVDSDIEERIDLAFWSADTIPPGKTNTAAYQPIDAEDPPELMQDGTVDLGAVATEFLLLALDPYPRKEGVTFDPPESGDPATHPFAALAALKKREGR
jgi:uncharacterized metal-binding protein YceD (DUF177 family)